MIRSMTGYGRGEGAFNDVNITIELRSVNNRYLDCSIRMPRTCIFAEEALKEQIQSSVGRGKVDVFVNIAHTGGEALSVTVNEALAKGYIDALAKLHELSEGAAGSEYSVSELARFPDVLTVEKQEDDMEVIKAQLLEVLALAIDDFNSMRIREGAKLAEDILKRADTIEALTALVEERSPKTVEEYRCRLERKMQEVLQNVQIDPGRLLTEAAIFADKIAVDEETVRLHSHLEQLRALLHTGGAVGRKLDFLIQEFNREANTIGSKCSDIEITRTVVEIKSEIEKIREQVQNIE